MSSLRLEAAFTLIELMVVVLVMGILVALGLPTFVGARNRAADRGAQADLRTSLAAAFVAFSDNEDFAGADSSRLQEIETSIDFTAPDTPSTGTPMTVSVAVGDVAAGDSMVWGGARLSTSGSCFYVTAVAAGVSPGTLQNAELTADGALCTGEEALSFTASDGTW